MGASTRGAGAFLLSAYFVSALMSVCLGGSVLHNGDMENMDSWRCWTGHCELTTDHHCGHHGIQISNRTRDSDGLVQLFNATPNFMYSFRAYAKVLSDVPGKLGQNLGITIDYVHSNGRHTYQGLANRHMARVVDGWILLQGSFQVPNQPHEKAYFKFQGPDPSVSFVVDCASMTHIWYGHGWREPTDQVIQNVRQADIVLNVTTRGNINPHDVEIQVLQKNKSFPLGTAVNAWHYLDSSQWRYRDFIHQHFNWAVHESTMKWHHIEPRQGHYDFQKPLQVLDSLRSQGIKVRGHNLIWPAESLIQDWVKALSGDDLKAAVRHHIVQTMNKTRGKLEHWDVNNENVHHFWYQQRLQDFSYEETPFRIAHGEDPTMKLFLNDYDIVAHGRLLGAYIDQAKRLQKANVGLYGLGVQCHFWNEEIPNPHLLKARLDVLAQTGLPIWVTEFNVQVTDENKRADALERAMRAFYGHPAVEGILFWGFWDHAHIRGPAAALTTGDNMELTAAGRRFLDLWEREWMTDRTFPLTQNQSHVTVRGFHGDYEVLVHYQGRELNNLKQTFTLGKNDHSVVLDVHV